MDHLRVKLARFNEVLDFGNRNSSSGRHHGIEIARRLAVREIAPRVSFPRFHECEVGLERHFHDVVAPLEFAYFLSFSDHRPHTSWSEKRRNACAGGANAFGERPLGNKIELHRSIEDHSLEQLILADVGSDVMPDLTASQQQSHTEAIDAGIVADGCQIFGPLVSQRADQVLRHATKAKAADHDGCAVKYVVDSLFGACDDFVHGKEILQARGGIHHALRVTRNQDQTRNPIIGTIMASNVSRASTGNPLVEPLPTRDEPKPSGRRKVIITVAIAVFLLLTVLVLQGSFNLKFISPDSNQQLLFFVALSALIFLLFVFLSVVLGRNLLKLYAERRLRVAGSKFRTRLVVVSLLLSFLPVIAMFWFSYGLMNRSIDKWFSQPVEEVRSDTAAMAALMSEYAGENATAEARAMAESPVVQSAFANRNFGFIQDEFRRHQRTLQGGFVVALLNNNAAASLGVPANWAIIREQLPIDRALRGENPHFRWDQRDYVLGAAPVESGAIVVGMALPAKFSDTVRQIQESQQRYFELAQQRRLVRRTYIGFLLLLTVLVLFASTWLALFLSKLVNRPVAALAAGTEAISKGQLDYRVDIRATDELAELVQSFNSMAEQLESSRRQIEASSRELAIANEALERRRSYIETILESIPTGVVSIDASRRVTLVNAALLRLFYLDRPDHPNPASLVNLPLRELLPEDVIGDLEPLLRRADRMGMTAANLELTLTRSNLNVAVTVSSLEYGGQRLGYVLVFEDLSDVLRAQKQAAWREVARRVAHEIKNPLTPIALSAERIDRHLAKGSTPDPASLEIIRSCAQTIGHAVETVRTLVDEFAALARFPASRPQPSNLNSLVENALSMFNGRLEGIEIRTRLAEDLPNVMADPAAIQRAVANLVDNAAEAMQNTVVREITISTALVASRDAVELVVADTGPGISREIKERLFLPYFSTKQRGTGLGLAIVSRIIEDHRGSIRVEENKPVGSRFVVEIPVVPEAVIVSGGQST